MAIVGPSGIGKTTVAATVLGLIPARAGEVVTHGRIGYLAQDAHIFTTTITENVRIGNRDATDADVAEALARAGLDLDPQRQVGEGGESLSGGEARRVALSRLLVGDYQVMILDEPTEHLDAATATALIDDIWAGQRRPSGPRDHARRSPRRPLRPGRHPRLTRPAARHCPSTTTAFAPERCRLLPELRERGHVSGANLGVVEVAPGAV